MRNFYDYEYIHKYFYWICTGSDRGRVSTKIADNYSVWISPDTFEATAVMYSAERAEFERA